MNLDVYQRFIGEDLVRGKRLEKERQQQASILVVIIIIIK